MKTSTVYVLVMFSALFWGSNFVLAGMVMSDVQPLWAAVFRFVIGAAIMIALVGWRREDLIGPVRRHAGAYALLGAVGIGAFNLLFFFALQHTSPANASLIMATNPLLTTALAAVVLGERAEPRQLAALPLALIGVIIVISGGHVLRLASMRVASGDIIMLGANLAWALYNVLGRRYMPASSALVNTTLMMIAGALLLLLVASGSGEPLTAPGMKAGLALLAMALGGTVLAYLFWTIGIARLGAGRTSLFLNLVPVFAMLIDAAFGMAPTMPQLIGGLLVIGAVGVSTMPRRRLAVA